MIKYRIGIIGAENSHADSFAKRINMPDEAGNFCYPDCRITMVTGHYPDANKALAEKFSIDRVVDAPEEMLGNVDAVVITARDGKYHWEFAKPFIEAGIPVFVDKPFTADIGQAEEMVALAKEKGVPLCGGSGLKHSVDVQYFKDFVQTTELDLMGGSLSAPVQLNSEHSGFYFYAPHLVEMTLEIFGYHPHSVTAVKHADSVCCMVHYDNFTVSNHFKEKSKPYTAVLYATKYSEYREVRYQECEDLQCDEFVKMLRTGKMAYTYEQLVAPVYLMTAIIKSYETGKTVKI